jgi:hypothetical protein
VDRARNHALASEELLHIASSSRSQEQMLGLDDGLAEHPRLVLGQQDRVVCLISEQADRGRLCFHLACSSGAVACARRGGHI